jgi:hypothetical protein
VPVIATLKDGRCLAKATTPNLTIPIGGGSAATTLSAGDFGLRKIEAVIHVNVIRGEPIVNDVYTPTSWVSSDGLAAGVSLFAGTGTTLAGEITVLGF